MAVKVTLVGNLRQLLFLLAAGFLTEGDGPLAFTASI